MRERGGGGEEKERERYKNGAMTNIIVHNML